MMLRIQQTIEGKQYSTNEQTIDTKGLTDAEIRIEIQKAKEYADLIQSTYSKQSGGMDTQMAMEYTELKKVLEKVQTTSEQKSVILEACKTKMGVEVYETIKEETINSPHFKKITLHQKQENE